MRAYKGLDDTANYSRNCRSGLRHHRWECAGWVNHNNGHKLSEGQAIPAGVFGGALLCGGLAYLLTPEPPPPPPKPPPPPPAPKVERTIILDDVLFDFDKSTIKPEAAQILDRLVVFRNENRNTRAAFRLHGQCWD